MKRDYTKAYKKKLIQEIVFKEKNPEINKLIGLAGPNITDYLHFCKSHGIKQAEIYENAYTNIIYQMQDFKPPISTMVMYQDIYEANLVQDVVYDLDFCCTIRNAEKHIKKFKDVPNIVTLSLRGISLKETIKRFCKTISKLKPEIIFDVASNKDYKHHIIKYDHSTFQKTFKLFQYRDTSPMLIISNF